MKELSYNKQLYIEETMDIDLNKVQKVADLLGLSAEYVVNVITPVDRVVMNSITTIAEANTACNAAPYGSQTQISAIKKWDSLTKQRVIEASNLLEVRSVFLTARMHSRAQMVALKKWLSLCATFEEGKDAYYSVIGYRVKRLALKKWLSLCITPVEATELIFCTSNDEETRTLVMEKWNSLSKQHVVKALTLLEAKARYHAAPEDSEAQRLAIRKMYKLATQ